MAAAPSGLTRVRGLALVRHGETAWSRSGQHTGRTDIELLDSGRAGARALGPLVTKLPITVAYTSPLRRASETAQLLGLDEAPGVMDDLVEWDYGVYEGLTSAEIRREHPDWDLFRDGCPDGESPEQICARADRVLAHFEFDPHAEGVALLISHGHMLRVLTTRYLGFDIDRARHFVLAPAHLSQLGHEHATRALESWNVSA
jgi:broad specificity phosphatase PhoE